MSSAPVNDQQGMTTCYRHPDRRAGVRCQRCNNPICPSCMVQASVGFHCPDCAHKGAQKIITPNSLNTQPIVTMVLIGLNIAAFIAQLATADDFGQMLGWRGGSGWVSDHGALIGYGRLDGMFIGVHAGEYWRIVTGGFLHGGFLHLALNMSALWFVGKEVEQRLGRPRFLALYIVGLVGGAFGGLLVSPTLAGVGASCAILALAGAELARQRSEGINIMESGLGAWLLMLLVITFLLPGVGIGGHIGGFVVGVGMGWIIFQMDRRVESPWVAVGVCAVVAAVLFVGCIWAASQWMDPVLGFLDLRR